MRRNLTALLALLALCGLAARWAQRANSSRLQLMFLISQFDDGSHCYYVRVDGAKVETHGGNPRPLSTQQLEEVVLALEVGQAWSAENADYSRSGDAKIYSQIVLQQGSRSRRVSWKCVGPSECRLVDRLLASPVGPELREAISSAVGSLRASLPPPAEPRRRIVGCGCRQEILLERVAAIRVVPLLEFRYPGVVHHAPDDERILRHRFAQDCPGAQERCARIGSAHIPQTRVHKGRLRQRGVVS